MRPAPDRARLAAALAAVTAVPPDDWRVWIDDRETRWLRATARDIALLAREPRGATAESTVVPWRVDSPRAAWEALFVAGLVPASALGDPRRRFRCAACVGFRRAVGVMDFAPPTLATLRARAAELTRVGAPRARVHVHPADLDALEREPDFLRDVAALFGYDEDGLEFAGVLLVEDVDADRGTLVVPTVERLACAPCAESGVCATPVTVADGVAFAADWSAVTAVEELAREATGCDRVVWRPWPAADAGERTWETDRATQLADAVRARGYAIDRCRYDDAVMLAPHLTPGDSA
jgi:hypothetical protein